MESFSNTKGRRKTEEFLICNDLDELFAM